MKRVNPTTWKGSCGDNEDSKFCNFKIIGAKYFNKGAIATHPGIKDIYMKSSRDIIGHGTKITSIIAGNFVEGGSFFGYANGTMYKA